MKSEDEYETARLSGTNAPSRPQSQGLRRKGQRGCISLGLRLVMTPLESGPSWGGRRGAPRGSPQPPPSALPQRTPSSESFDLIRSLGNTPGTHTPGLALLPPLGREPGRLGSERPAPGGQEAVRGASCGARGAGTEPVFRSARVSPRRPAGSDQAQSSSPPPRPPPRHGGPALIGLPAGHPRSAPAHPPAPLLVAGTCGPPWPWRCCASASVSGRGGVGATRLGTPNCQPLQDPGGAVLGGCSAGGGGGEGAEGARPRLARAPMAHWGFDVAAA